MASRRNKGGLVARVNFPLYTIQMLTSRHILVGGGGGESKTGVANGFEIFEVSHNGYNFIAEEVTRHETGPNVVMNCATYNDGKKNWLAAGQESHCQLYNVKSRVVTLENGTNINTTTKENLRQRKKHNNNNNDDSNNLLKDKINTNINNKRLQLILEPSTSIKTDFSNNEPRQRIVRISPNGKFMATGGIDGIVRLWKFPELKEINCFKLHDKEIDDIDFNINSNYIATIAKDGKAFICDIIKNTKNKELKWTTPNGSKYMYKRLRFRITNDKKLNEQIFILSNATLSKNQSYLQLWDIEQGIIIKSTSFNETLSALAVSDDGTFVAVGTMFSGSVDIFIAFSLQRVLHVSNAHSMFITGLEFLHTKSHVNNDDNNSITAITSNCEAAVVSISVDNRICIHSIPYRHSIPFWLVIVLMVLIICGAFILCSYAGI